MAGVEAVNTLARLLAERGFAVRSAGTTDAPRVVVAMPMVPAMNTTVTVTDGQYAATFERGQEPESLGTDNPVTAVEMIARMLTPVVTASP